MGDSCAVYYSAKNDQLECPCHQGFFSVEGWFRFARSSTAPPSADHSRTQRFKTDCRSRKGNLRWPTSNLPSSGTGTCRDRRGDGADRHSAHCPDLAAERYVGTLPCGSHRSSSPCCDFFRSDLLGMPGSGFVRNASRSRVAPTLTRSLASPGLNAGGSVAARDCQHCAILWLEGGRHKARTISVLYEPSSKSTSRDNRYSLLTEANRLQVSHDGLRIGACHIKTRHRPAGRLTAARD